MPGKPSRFTSCITYSYVLVDSKHAKVEDATLSQITQLEDHDVEAAKKEWEDLVLTDEE